MIRPKNETEDSLLSITKNCEMLIKQTHRKAEETLEFKLSRPREAFYFNPPILIEASSMIGLTNLEVYNSIFYTSEEKIKFELYRETFDEFSFEQLKYELEEILISSDITPNHLQHEIIGPRIIEIC